MARDFRLTVEAARPRHRAISRIDEPEAIPREMSSRSARASASRERRRAIGGYHREGSNTARIEYAAYRNHGLAVVSSYCSSRSRLALASG